MNLNTLKMSLRLLEWTVPAGDMRMIQAQTIPMTQVEARLATSPIGTSIASKIKLRERSWFRMKLLIIQPLRQI